MEMFLTVSALSPSAKDAVRFNFNPSKIDEVSEIKMLTASLISRLEAIRDDAARNAAREAAVAITNVQTASMWAVLAATKGL